MFIKQIKKTNSICKPYIVYTSNRMLSLKYGEIPLEYIKILTHSKYNFVINKETKIL